MSDTRRLLSPLQGMMLRAIHFFGSKEPDEWYDYSSLKGDCANGQFCRHIGRRYSFLLLSEATPFDHVLESAAREEPHTMGALADRLRTALADNIHEGRT